MTAFRIISLFALIVACTPQETPATSRSAQFSAFPDKLFATFETSCNGPGEEFRKIGNRQFECQELLPPKTTAYLILNYDGYPQNLPKSVTRLTAEKNAGGYLVEADLFFNVPRETGPAAKVPVESKELDKTLSAIYRTMGGSPF